jgi:hypothetical protein
MEFFSVLTLQIPHRTATINAVVTVPSQATRAALYDQMRRTAFERLGKEFADATVLFFSAEPNIING